MCQPLLPGWDARPSLYNLVQVCHGGVAVNVDGDRARTSVAMQFFALQGGYQSPSPFDPLFEQLDADGQMSTFMTGNIVTR